MKRRVSTRSPDIGVAAMLDTAADTTRARTRFGRTNLVQARDEIRREGVLSRLLARGEWSFRGGWRIGNEPVLAVYQGTSLVQ